MLQQEQDYAKAKISGQFQTSQLAALQSDAKHQRLRELEQAEQNRLFSRAAAAKQIDDDSHPGVILRAVHADSSPYDSNGIDLTLTDLFLDDFDDDDDDDDDGSGGYNASSSTQLSSAVPVNRIEPPLISPSTHRATVVATTTAKKTTVAPSKIRSNIRSSVLAAKSKKTGKK